jgi:hypothetical protein
VYSLYEGVLGLVELFFELIERIPPGEQELGLQKRVVFFFSSLELSPNRSFDNFAPT